MKKNLKGVAIAIGLGTIVKSVCNLLSNNETIQKINNILTVNSATTSDFIYHIVMYSNEFCKKLTEENK